jgi:8-oxo-dGTP pyrophosphatase MutT (NUDIX family)
MSYILDIRKLVGHQRIISVACGAILENEKEEILLQLRSDTKDYSVPGGAIELGENLIDALIREVLEETNIHLEKDKVRLFGIYSGDKCLTIYPNLDEVLYVCLIFYIKLTTSLNIKPNEESEELAFFSRYNLPSNIKSSEQIWIKKWVDGNFNLEID